MGNAAILGILAYMREWEVCFGKTCGFVCTCDQISHGLELSVPIGSNRWSLPRALDPEKASWRSKERKMGLQMSDFMSLQTQLLNLIPSKHGYKKTVKR